MREIVIMLGSVHNSLERGGGGGGVSDIEWVVVVVEEGSEVGVCEFEKHLMALRERDMEMFVEASIEEARTWPEVPVV